MKCMVNIHFSYSGASKNASIGNLEYGTIFWWGPLTIDLICKPTTTLRARLDVFLK